MMARKKAAAGGRLGRPTRSMMEAVNLALEGRKKEALEKVKEDGRNTEEAFDRFLAIRQEKGGGYEFTRKARGTRVGRAVSDSMLSMIDGRTRIHTLVALRAKIDALLADRSERDVEAAREEFKEIETIHQKIEEDRNRLEEMKAKFGLKGM